MQQITNVEPNEKVCIENRKHLLMTGLRSVDGFSERTINITLNSGKAEIVGENIKITSYDQNKGVLSADGTINQIKYTTQKQPLVRRLFK